jgi:16S rRNA (adenine1518-N6/adenine1519-N6)-dimethyltransferase
MRAAPVYVTSELLGPADIRRLASRLGLRPTKTLGQNFVIDANTIRRIVRTASFGVDDVVLEVGPGLGSLTLGLLPVARSVVAVEVDRVLAAALPETVSERAPSLVDRLTVLHQDALQLRPEQLPDPAPTVLVANLPYNVAVPGRLRQPHRFLASAERRLGAGGLQHPTASGRRSKHRLRRR